MWQCWMGWNIYHCVSDIFWMVPCLICYLIVILFYIERMWHLVRNLATTLPLKSKLSGKFQRFNAVDGSIEMLKNSWISKIWIKIKNCKTFYEAKRLWNKNVLSEIYRNIQTFAFKVLQQYSSWASRNGAVRMFFLTPKRNICWKICKVIKVFGCAAGAYFFQFPVSWDSHNRSKLNVYYYLISTTSVIWQIEVKCSPYQFLNMLSFHIRLERWKLIY